MANPKYLSKAFMVVADDEAEDHCDLAEGASRRAKWEEADYEIISMNDDWKTIYGQWVKKAPFHFE
jgi:hypothetical protein